MPMMRRRRPVLRAAAVGGGAYAMGKRRERSMAQDAQAEQAAPAPQAAPPAGGGMSPQVMDQLKQLGELHDQGVLTDEEFAQQKQRLLGGGA